MLKPPDVPGIPGGDTIQGISDGYAELWGHAELTAGAATVPGLNAVWLTCP